MKPYKPTSRPYAREMRNHSTLSEVLLWMQLRASKLGYAIKRQVPMGSYILDFYCPALHLAIEVDGGIHMTPQAVKCDDIRTDVLQKAGITIIRVSAHDCEKNMENALRIIEAAMDEAKENLAQRRENLPRPKGHPLDEGDLK